ncbi:unnamed protein product [Lactuca saligna]|uniref:Uncharacterized protein n=1 Tax=Lactuca saligna TaxID=75948 RepID=A0AA35Z8Y2_LACSI|nr:unnamed protein product [Lactuca saligna]
MNQSFVSLNKLHLLELQYADEIKALEPPHTYVPWVVLDGQPLYDDYVDIISLICKAYKGSKTPQACHGLSLPVTKHKDTDNNLDNKLRGCMMLAWLNLCRIME